MARLSFLRTALRIARRGAFGPAARGAALVACTLACIVGGACKAEPDDPTTAPKAPAGRPRIVLPPCSAAGDPPLDGVFKDDFARDKLGDDWSSTSYGAYDIRNARLCTDKPKNHPLWLKRRLPTNVRVEFDATPLTNDADVKAEIFGDGCSYDPNGDVYESSGYVAVLGAHKNSEHWLARRFEHGKDARRTALIAGGATIANAKLVANVPHHVVLSREDGKELRFVVDDVVVHTFADADPLVGANHDHFAFDGWLAGVCFDNVVVTPLP